MTAALELVDAAQHAARQVSCGCGRGQHQMVVHA